MIMSEEQTPDNIPTPINLSVIMDEEESKVEQIFNFESDNDVNLNDTLSIDLIVCSSCNRQCTLEDQEDGLCCQPHLYCNLHSKWEGPIYRLPCCMSVRILDSAATMDMPGGYLAIHSQIMEQSILSHPAMTLAYRRDDGSTDGSASDEDSMPGLVNDSDDEDDDEEADMVYHHTVQLSTSPSIANIILQKLKH
jgi:hypothetical protein